MIPFITFYFYFMDTAYSHLPEIDFILLFIKFSSVSWFLFPPISTSLFFCFVSVFQVRDFLSIHGDPCCLFIFNSGLLGNHLTAPWESYQPLGLMVRWGPSCFIDRSPDFSLKPISFSRKDFQSSPWWYELDCQDTETWIGEES